MREGVGVMPEKPATVRFVVMAALAGAVTPADARAECPELERLQRAYFDASQHISQSITKPRPWVTPSPPPRELCASYRRLFEATKAWVEYARQQDDLCRFSGLLPMMERENLRAEAEGNNVCAGRPPQPWSSIFPAERGIRR